MPTFGVYPTQVTWSVSAVDSSGGSVSGASIKTVVIDPTTTVTWTPSSSPKSYTAGSSPITFTASLSPAQAGVPVYFLACAPGSPAYSWCSIGAGDYSAGASWSVGATRVVTGSSGSASTAFQPSNVMADGSKVNVAMEVGLDCNYDCSTVEVDTAAGSPSQVTVTLPGSPDYVRASATAPGDTSASATIASGAYSVSLTDAFTNPVAFAAGDVLTLFASTGKFASPSGAPTTTKTSITCADFSGAVCPTSGTSYTVANAYYQSLVYGSVGTISAQLVRSSTTFTGLSSSIITSTVDVATNAPSTSPAAPVTVNAGSTVKVYYNLTTIQKGVPVTFYLDSSSTQANGDGKFSNGAQSITVSTGNIGAGAQVTFTTDTGAGAVLYFTANVAAPDNTLGATNMLGNATNGNAVSTQAGSPAKLIVSTYFDSGLTESTKYAVNVAGTTLYVNIELADKYNNPTTNSFTYQIQITLSGPGTFSATSVYVSSGCSDTAGVTSACTSAFGPILWTTPTALGSATISASSSLSTTPATKTVTIVSAFPSLFVNTANGKALASGSVLYVNAATVIIGGNASVSKGYPSTETINSVCYTAGTASGCASITAANVVNPWSIVLGSLTEGPHTISFNATDSQGNVQNSTSYTLLVDTTAPNVNFITADNANVTAGTPVTANFVDAMGDLNASSVSVVGTNLDTSATATFTASVTGTNNPGHSVTYAVSISGMTTGNWSLTLSGADLAGNTNSSTITVHVTVQFGESFAVVGTPSLGTLGGYSGINVVYQNANPTSESVVIFAVWKNSAGQTVGIGAGSATVAPGAQTSAFIVEPIGLASGSYTVNLFVWTTGNLPVSITTTITVST